MIEYLAAGGDDAHWWIGFAVPAGVIAGAAVAGLFGMRTTRKSPHEKLEKLLGMLKDWPEDLPGKETVYRSIAETLGQIRQVDKLQDIPATTPGDESAVETEIDRMVELHQREWSWQRGVFILILTSLSLVFSYIFITIGMPPGQAVSTTLLIAVATSWLVAGGGSGPQRIARALAIFFGPGDDDKK